MATSSAGKTRQLVRRAQRYSTELPIRYREAGTPLWHKGRTENISVSGVLFRAEQVLRPKTVVEIAITLPAWRERIPGEIRCRGSIVRSATAMAGGSSPVLAASIKRYRLVHGPEGPRLAM